MKPTIAGKLTKTPSNTVYTGGIAPEYTQAGLNSKKTLETAKNLFYSLVIAATLVLIGLVLELIK